MLKRLKGGHKFESTSFASCLIAENEEKVDELILNELAANNYHKNFENVVAFLGKPGFGKSCAASTVYNVMRQTDKEYFEVSRGAEFTFTKGIWMLNRDTKVVQSEMDVVDILDLEGLEDDNLIKYLIVIAMTLCKALVIFSKSHGTGRRDWSSYKTIADGYLMLKGFKIIVPKPVLFVDVPHGQTEFFISRRETVDFNGLVTLIKQKFPNLEDFEMRQYCLTEFEDNTIDDNYIQSVSKLISQLEAVREKGSCRLEYATQLIKALNANSPSMVLQLNLDKFKTTLIYKINTCKKSAIQYVTKECETIQLEDEISLSEFSAIKFRNGIYRYDDLILKMVPDLDFYDQTLESTNTDQTRLIAKETQDLFLKVENHCTLIYKLAISKLKNKMILRGEKLFETHTTNFERFVNSTISSQIKKIKHRGDTHLPYELRTIIEDKRRDLKRKLRKTTKESYEIPSAFLELDLEDKWMLCIIEKKNQWAIIESRALEGNRKIRVSGELECPKCGNQHTDGVHHKPCPQGLVYYWVDGPTQTGICEGCEMVESISSLVCAKCEHPLDTHIIPWTGSYE